MARMKHWLIVVLGKGTSEKMRGVFSTEDTAEGAAEAFASFDLYEERGYRPFLFSLVEDGKFENHWCPVLTSDGPWPIYEEVCA